MKKIIKLNINSTNSKFRRNPNVYDIVAVYRRNKVVIGNFSTKNNIVLIDVQKLINFVGIGYEFSSNIVDKINNTMVNSKKLKLLAKY